jgi:hypothetical protein
MRLERRKSELYKTNQGRKSNLATEGCTMLYKSSVIKIKEKKSDFGGFQRGKKKVKIGRFIYLLFFV